MDKLDVKIVRELLQGDSVMSIWAARASARPALSALSRKLGVTENTVRERHRKLSRFVSGWTLMPNPGLYGEKCANLSFDVPNRASKERILDHLRLIEDVVVMGSYVGPKMDAIFYYRDEAGASKKVDLIKQISGCDDAVFTDIPFPPCSTKLSEIDLRIVASRQDDITKSDLEIAKELGVSARTVKRRYMRLVKGGAIFPIAQMAMEELRDSVYAVLEVHCRDEMRTETEAKIRLMVDDYLIFDGHFVKFTSFNLIISGISAANTLLERVKRLEGVKSARIDFAEKRLGLYEVYRQKVDEQLARVREN